MGRCAGSSQWTETTNFEKTTMDRPEASNRQSGRAVEYSTSGATVGARLAGAYDPTLYSNLPPHEKPLSPDLEEQWVDDLSRTLPLGIGSTQDWMGGHSGQREAVTSRHSFSALLENDVGGGDMEIVDLDFGLSSGSGPTATHTRTFNPVPGVTVGGSSMHGESSSLQGVSPDGCRPPPPFSRGAGSSGDMFRMSLPPPSTSPLSDHARGWEHQRRTQALPDQTMSATDALNGRGEHNEWGAKAVHEQVMEVSDCVSLSESIVQFCCAMASGAIPRATPKWWMRRRTGGTWEDLRKMDDTAEGYYKEKLQMSRRVFLEIVEALSPNLQRSVTLYREPLMPDHVAYALYRWASGETYESSTSSFGIGRASGLIAVEDVTRALLSVYREKIIWPSGLWRLVVLRAFEAKGFPNCYGCMDDTYIYVGKPANAPSENYFDRKHHFSVVALAVVDLDLHVTDVFVGYPGSCHDIRVLQLSSLWMRNEAGDLFRGPVVLLPFGVQTRGYILGYKGYPPMEWIVVPFGGTDQIPDEERFDNKQKVASGVVERPFGRLKGMWRFFLRTCKTNMDTLPQQFQAVCILHNILPDVGIDFDDNLLWEVDANGVRRRVDLGMGHPPHSIVENFNRPPAMALGEALAERMKHE
ncbi:hypothetical protein CBR_g57066 [Chara braunii]|uniref:DDE Tnp4 domain-containing protein n=1 Tax=Chara braunii TaxID=69332 RepID=A0A388K7Z7_CHABU|nr:hypothetical protein CBR_g57066 [Chara braunii]|eukprot:GBG66185.1 hypothetical protein CBR_g57066 [Chara braunii]